MSGQRRTLKAIGRALAHLVPEPAPTRHRPADEINLAVRRAERKQRQNSGRLR